MSDAPEKCPRCDTMLAREDDDLMCIMCGWRDVEAMAPRPNSRNMPAFGRKQRDPWTGKTKL